MIVTQKSVVDDVGQIISQGKLTTEIVIKFFLDDENSPVIGVIDDFINSESISLITVIENGMKKKQPFFYKDFTGYSILNQSELLSIINRLNQRIKDMKCQMQRAKSIL
jgi:hypothetical protein